MEINNSTNLNFKAFKYLNTPFSPRFLAPNYPQANKVFNTNPPQELVKLAENSPLLKKLAEKTDVFISSKTEDMASCIYSNFEAVFKDPFDETKKNMDILSLIAYENRANDCKNKFDKMLKEFPENYEEMKNLDRYSNTLSIGRNFRWTLLQDFM